MGASFRNVDEILEQSPAADLLTISPQYLEELSKSEGAVVRKLDKKAAKKLPLQKISLDESAFRVMLNNNAWPQKN